MAVLSVTLLAAACAENRLSSPNAERIPPDIRRALEASDQSGSVAVARVIKPNGSSYVRVLGEEPPVKRRLRHIRYSLGTRQIRVPDLHPALLLFRIPPAGTGRANTAEVVITFFCIVNGESNRAFDVRVDDIESHARAGTGGHLSEHDLDSKPVGTWDPASGHTAADGTFTTTYTSDVAAGDEEVTFRYTILDAGSECQGASARRSFFIGIRYPGLRPIRSLFGIYYDNITSDHNTVFWATPESVVNTYRTAALYRALTIVNDQVRDDSLRVNAASLLFGGINDILRNWRPPHDTHRIGTDVDMDGFTDSQRIWDIVKRAGVAAGFSSCEVHDQNHIHCNE